MPASVPASGTRNCNNSVKTRERNRGLASATEARNANDDLLAISIYRSEISPQLATTLFFAKVPTSASGS